MKFHRCVAPGMEQPALIDDAVVTHDLSLDGFKARRRHSVGQG